MNRGFLDPRPIRQVNRPILFKFALATVAVEESVGVEIRTRLGRPFGIGKPESLGISENQIVTFCARDSLNYVRGWR